MKQTEHFLPRLKAAPSKSRNNEFLEKMTKQWVCL